mgnify:CR=1 FL=1
MTTYKQLLTTDNAEQGSSNTQALGGLTIPRQLYGTLLQAVQRKLIWRPLAAFSFGPSDIPGSSIDVDYEDEENAGLSVVEVAEGAEFTQMVSSISTYNVKCKKYGARIGISEEMMEDGKFALMERQAQIAGYKVAQKQNGLIVDTVRGNAGNTVSGGASLTVANITTMMKNVEAAGYSPTDFVIGTSVAEDIRNIDIFVHADKSGVTNPSQALIGKIYNMNVWLDNNLAKGNTGAATDAYVCDREHAFMYAEKRPVTMKAWEDMYKDVSNRVVSFRFVARYHRANAICRATTT